MRLSTALLAATLLAGCGARGVGRTPAATLRPACTDAQAWDGTTLPPARGGRRASSRAAPRRWPPSGSNDALAMLTRALMQAPHPHAEHAAIYEQLGIAYAYLGREPDALAAFDMLLQLDPGHLLSYNLSPKVTLTFERARAQAARRPPPELQIQWPNGLAVAQPLPIDLEVVADPRRLLDRATIYVKRRGEPRFSAVDLETVAARPAPPRDPARHPVGAPRGRAGLRVGPRSARQRGPALGRPVSSARDPAALRPAPAVVAAMVGMGRRGGVIAAGSAVVFFATRPLPENVGGDPSVE